MKFVFDFDSTITCAETIPLLARRFGADYAGIERLTSEARGLDGDDYEANLRCRIDMLCGLPVSRVADFVSGIAVHRPLVEFISVHSGDCAIVSANLDCWCSRWLEWVECKSYFTPAAVENDIVTHVGPITDKAAVVRQLRDRGETVVFVGDSSSDCPAMRCADFSIAFGSSASPSAKAEASVSVDTTHELIKILEEYGQS